MRPIVNLSRPRGCNVLNDRYSLLMLNISRRHNKTPTLWKVSTFKFNCFRFDCDLITTNYFATCNQDGESARNCILLNDQSYSKKSQRDLNMVSHPITLETHLEKGTGWRSFRSEYFVMLHNDWSMRGRFHILILRLATLTAKIINFTLLILESSSLKSKTPC